MAESLVSGLTESFLVKLGSLVIQKIGKWRDIKEEFKKLQSIVCTIELVLLDAEEKHVQSKPIREWLGKLKDALYDADDLLDNFSTYSLKRNALSGGKITKKVRGFLSGYNRLVYGYKMAHKVKGLRERFDEIANERNLFHLEIRLEDKPFLSVGRDQTHSHVSDEEVIGRGDDKKNIIELLLNEDVEDNVLIIPIIGFGGLGKTTLAQYVYNDGIVQSRFEVKMWVCVSEPFDVKTIVEKMIKSATNGGELGNLEMDQLQLSLRGIIDEKRYLLVLDDVWNDNRNTWLELEKLLMGGAKGSRIIVTTRSKTVANITSTFEPYVLNGLSEEEGWVLFTRRAFRHKGDLDHKTAIEVGKRIVKKCVGVPLAITTMGGLLFSLDPKTHWFSFESKEFSKIAQNQNDILPSLQLSYDHLPSYLKNCFGYCKLFPKNTKIDVQDLIFLWMAQGYIVSSDIESSLSDIGLQYFKDLLWRSFFQEVQIDELGNISSCKMHDLMHDLATLVGGAETILMTSTQISSHERTRHISVQWSPQISSLIASSNMEKIRTLWAFHPSSFTALFNLSLTCIRTLKLGGAGLEIIPDSIGELCHMRYLDLSRNPFKILPNSITKLVNLQTLHLEQCLYFETFPVHFNALKRLVCLNVKDCFRLKELPLGLRDLTSLESLKEFKIREDSKMGLQELNGLNQLRGNLSISGLEYSTKNDAAGAGAGCLKEKQHLQSLQLSWSPTEIGRDEIGLEGLQPHLNLKSLSVIRYAGVMFAGWLSSLTNLVSLELQGCSNLKYLPPLDGLTMLRTLTIVGARELEYVEEEKCKRVGLTMLRTLMNGSKPISVFPSLERVTLYDCQNLKGWWENEESHSHYYFPTLSYLEIMGCPKLTAMPSFPCVERYLGLMNTSGKPLVQTMKMTPSSSREIPQTFPLSKVKSLSVSKITDLAYLPLESLHSLERLWIDECINLNLSAEMEWKSLASLQRLCIQSCENVCLVSGMFQHLTSLEKLKITNLPQLISLPDDISTLTSLRALNIESCENVCLVSGMFQHLTSLEKLAISDLPQLISLPDDISTVTSLRKLEIFNCSKLISLCEMRALTSLRRLYFGSCPELISLPDDISALTSLRELKIKSCESLRLPSGMFQHLTSLEELTISHLPLLISLPDDISTLTSLRELKIESCEKLHLPSGMFQHLTSLEELRISNLPQLISLPDDLSTLTSLQTLIIQGCSELISLSEMRALTSLRCLYFGSCPELISLPDDISTLTSLRELQIFNCPYLLTRYQKETGVERHKIAHIPHLILFNDDEYKYKDENTDKE